MMKNEYRKIMDRISLSDEERINILNEAKYKAQKHNSYLKPLLASACAVLFAFVGWRVLTPSEPDSNTMVVNPMQTFDDVASASEAVGFALSSPAFDSIESIHVIKNEIVQIKGLYEGMNITFRIAQGSDDISGDFNSYEQEQTLLIDGHEVIAKGNADLISLVLWQHDSYTYSLSCEGLSEESITTLIESMTMNQK